MPRFCRAGATAVVGLAAVALAGCASTPQTAARHSKEYFPSSVYGAASPRVVADGQPVPRGGGQYLVGHPYTVAGRVYVPRENPSYVGGGLGVLVRRRLPRPDDRQRRSLRQEQSERRASDNAAAELRASDEFGNGYSVIVRVNDRGPFHGGRVMDVSSRVADVLDIKAYGTAKVKVEYVGPAPMEGSDDEQLLASLRTDGSAARLDGYAAPNMVADAAPRATDALTSLFAARPAPPPPPVRPTAEAAAPAPQPTAEATVAVDREDVAEAPASPHRRIAAHPPVPPERPFDLSSAKSNLPVLVASSSHSSSSKPSHSYGPFAKLLDRDARGGKADN